MIIWSATASCRALYVYYGTGVLDRAGVAVKRDVDVGTAVLVGVSVMVGVGDGAPVGVTMASAR